MIKTFKKAISIFVLTSIVLGSMTLSGLAATFGGETLEDAPLTLSESFDSWTTIKDAYNGTNTNKFKHKYSVKNTTSRRQPAINEIATATANMSPYKSVGDIYLDFRMMGGPTYTNKYGTTPTDNTNLVSTPRLYIQDYAAIENIVDEKLHVSFEIKTDDLHKEKHVKYCPKWNDTTRGNMFLIMKTNGTMQIGNGSNRVLMPYKLGRWYKFDFIIDFGNKSLASYVDGNKVYESDDGLAFTLTTTDSEGDKLTYTSFFEFVISGAAIDIPEGESSGMGIDNLNISLHNASDEITIAKKQGLPATEMGTPVIPEYEFGSDGSYTAKIPYTLFDLGQSGQIVVASYNSDGSLDSVSVGDSVNSDTLACGKILSATVNVSKTADRIKVFLLESMDSIIPIIPETEISKTN